MLSRRFCDTVEFSASNWKIMLEMLSFEHFSTLIGIIAIAITWIRCDSISIALRSTLNKQIDGNISTDISDWINHSFVFHSLSWCAHRAQFNRIQRNTFSLNGQSHNYIDVPGSSFPKNRRYWESSILPNIGKWLRLVVCIGFHRKPIEIQMPSKS